MPTRLGASLESGLWASKAWTKYTPTPHDTCQVTSWESPQPCRLNILPLIRTLKPRSTLPSLHPLNQSLRTVLGLHVVYCASNNLNNLHFQHPVDHRCLGRLCKDNWNRPFRKSFRCRDRTSQFSRGYPRAAPRTREGIQGLSGRKSEANQLPQSDRECDSGVLGHSRRGGQPGKSHVPSGNPFNVTSSGPLPTSKRIVRWDQCPPLCSSL
jgi:hypothetical protein